VKRKAKIPPFRRPSVDLSHHNRVWKTVLAEDLEKGDVVQDRGLVVATQLDSIDGKVASTLFFANGEDITLKFSEQVYAFVKRDDD